MAVDDAGERVGEIGVRIDAVELAGFDQRGDDSPIFPAAIRAGEESVLAIEGDGPDRTLDCIGVDLDPAVVEETGEAVPVRERVADRLGELALLADEGELFAQPGLEIGDERIAIAPGGRRVARPARGRECRSRSDRARRCAAAPSLAIGEASATTRS